MNIQEIVARLRHVAKYFKDTKPTEDGIEAIKKIQEKQQQLKTQETQETALQHAITQLKDFAGDWFCEDSECGKELNEIIQLLESCQLTPTEQHAKEQFNQIEGVIKEEWQKIPIRGSTPEDHLQMDLANHIDENKWALDQVLKTIDNLEKRLIRVEKVVASVSS